MFKIILKITCVLIFNCFLRGYAIDSNENLDNLIAQIDSENAISYTYLRKMPGVCEKLKQSYHGIDDEVKLDQLLEKQNYVEVLKHIWTEPDIKKRLSWLEKKVNLGHPILMFELGEAYLLNSPDPETFFYKAIPWIKAGCFRTMIDAKCVATDQSVDAASLLLFAYDQSSIMSQFNETQEQIANYCNKNAKEIFMATHQITLQVLKPFLSMESASKMPSPNWLSAQKNLKVNEWFEVRKKAAEEILQESEAGLRAR